MAAPFTPTAPTLPTTQYVLPASGITKYYTNCRGINYVPFMENEWKKSGYFPRIPSVLGYDGGGYDLDEAFMASQKTTMWYYYDSSDNDYCLSILRSVGINAIRVFTSIFYWEKYPTEFKDRLDDFMSLCDKHKIRVQLVLWDSIQSSFWSQTPEPSSTAMQVSSLEYCLTTGWHRVPHTFQTTEANASNFLVVSATPFITDIAQTVSSHQSMWSIDVANEVGVIQYLNDFIVSSCIITSSIVSSLGIPITFGLTVPDSYYSLSSWTADLYHQASGVYNFISIHAYTNNQVDRRNKISKSVSAAIQLSAPAMANESVYPKWASQYDTEVSGFRTLNFGHMAWDGFIQRPQSYEPFRDTNGIFYHDGEVRDAAAASSYSWLAEQHGWLSKKQYRFNFKEKTTSVDEGADGGFWSGVIPEHQSFNSDEYISATQTKWDFHKAIEYLYSDYNSPNPLAAYSKQFEAKNFTPYAGHPMDGEVANYGISVERLSFSSLVTILRNWDTYWTPLANIAYSLSGSDFRTKDIQLYKRDEVLYYAQQYMSTQLSYKLPSISGSVYDYSVVPQETALNFSSAYYPISRTDGSSVIMVVGPTLGLSSSAPCLVLSSCLYVDDDQVAGIIDWGAYDTMYQQCADTFVACIDYIEDAAVTDDRYQLYP